MKLDFTPAPRRTLKVFQPYTGTGKSYAAAEYLAEVAGYPAQDNGKPLLRVTYASPSHRVASDMERALVDRGVAAEAVVHRWSVLVERTELDGTVVPACQRREELQTLIEAGTGLQPRKVCIRCPFRDECPAYAAALVDDDRAKTAAVSIITHAALGGEVEDGPLICDEPPSYLDELSLSGETLSLIRGDAPLASVLSLEREVARQIARGWLSGRDFLELPVGFEQQDEDGNDVPRETIRQWLTHRNGSAFDVVNGRDLPEKATPAVLAAMRGVRDVLRIASWDLRRGAERRRGVRGIEVALPSAAILRLREQGGVLLDGTPWLSALRALFDEVIVPDVPPVDWTSLPVTREWRESNAVSKVRLCHSYWNGSRFNDEPTCRRVEGEVSPGINWPLIENELRLTLAETEGTTLFGSFKLVVDVLAGRTKDHVERGGVLAPLERERLASLLRVREAMTARGVETCSFGGVRSRNDWQTVRQVLVVGSPFMNSQRVAEALGLEEDEVEPATSEYARGELVQTAERGRSVRRTSEDPVKLTLVCATRCRPEGWGDSKVYPNGGVTALSAEERAVRARGWLKVALRAHGEDVVRPAVGAPSTARGWRKWLSGEVDVSHVEGRIAELLPEKSHPAWVLPYDERPETQAAWRALLDVVHGKRGIGLDKWKKTFSVLRHRGIRWHISLEIGLVLEKMASVSAG